MKTIIYSSALLLLFSSLISCNKESLKPISSKGPIENTGPIAKPACDSSKEINYVLTNYTGIDSYEIAFSGPVNYTFTFPASGSKTVTVKPGSYSVYVYSPGVYLAQYFSLNGATLAKGTGARYENVQIGVCAGSQSLTISPAANQ